MDPFFHTGLSISDSLKTVRKSVLIYETIILILKDAAGGELKDFFAGIDQGNREYERILDEYVERLSDAVFNIRMLYDDTVLIGGELGEYADYFIEKVWGILDSQDIYREESAKDYVKVCEDGENVIAIGAAMYYINQAAVRL